MMSIIDRLCDFFECTIDGLVVWIGLFLLFLECIFLILNVK